MKQKRDRIASFLVISDRLTLILASALSRSVDVSNLFGRFPHQHHQRQFSVQVTLFTQGALLFSRIASAIHFGKKPSYHSGSQISRRFNLPMYPSITILTISVHRLRILLPNPPLHHLLQESSSKCPHIGHTNSTLNTPRYIKSSLSTIRVVAY